MLKKGLKNPIIRLLEEKVQEAVIKQIFFRFKTAPFCRIEDWAARGTVGIPLLKKWQAVEVRKIRGQLTQ